MSFEAFETLAIHGGLAPDPTTGAILTPIHQSTTFVQQAVGVDKGFTYSRTANPTVAALEQNLGALEHALPAATFASGMAALSALFLGLLQAGDHVLCGDVVYGGTVRLLRQVLARFGLQSSFVDSSDLALLRDGVRPNTRLVLIETPGNPTLVLTDIAAAAEIAHAAGAWLAVDNTFLTPALQRPLDQGADIAIYSTTKYIEGHNTTVGGSIVTRDPEIRVRIKFVQNAVGFGQKPFEAWLTLRGVKTLSLRLRQHCAGAQAVAEWLAAHPLVRRVAYPGLASFPQHELARRQQSGFGGMIAFEVEGGVEAGKRLLSSLRLVSLAENLGAVESLVTHPASMTHADVPREDRERAGIGDGLIRLSVGLEDPGEIIADLAQAIEAAVPALFEEVAR